MDDDARAKTEFEQLFEGYQRRDVILEAEVEHLGRKRQVARVDLVSPAAGDGWELRCDEPETLGGEGTGPPPLAFLLAGVAMCFMSKIPQYAEVLRVPVPPLRVKARWGMHTQGSALQGTLLTTPIALELSVDIVEGHPPGRLDDVVQVAQRACHAVQAMVAPVPTRISLLVGGEECSR